MTVVQEIGRNARVIDRFREIVPNLDTVQAYEYGPGPITVGFKWRIRDRSNTFGCYWARSFAETKTPNQLARLLANQHRRLMRLEAAG